MNDAEFERACRFLNELAAAVQRYGVSSHAMESLLSRVARALHLRGEFLATPTQVQSILWGDDEHRQRLHISVSSAGNFDLTKLARITELVGQVESGKIPPEVGSAQLEAIDDAGPQYGHWVDALAFVLCGLGFAVILGISWLDVLLSGLLSLGSFALTRLATNSQGLANILELAVAALASALATLLALVFPGINVVGIAVCAFIYFVPGFGFTLAASELMSGNTLSGMIGFTRATVSSGKLFVGFLIGTALVQSQVSVPMMTTRAEVSHAWTWAFVPMLVLGLAILFRVRRRDLVWSLLGGFLVWVGVESGAELGFWPGTFLGALILTAGSRLFTWLSKLPAAIILLPAVMLLVPGLTALRALYVADTQGLVAGLRVGYDVFILIAAILGGLLLGDALWSIRRPLFPPLLSGLSRIRGAVGADRKSGPHS